jgi:hypothetical protein
MRISVSSIVDSQLPSFVREEYPLFSEFLKQYYLSDVSQDLVQNLDKNLDLDVIFNLRTTAILSTELDFNDDVVYVDNTEGFPDSYGLIKIDDEIILYTSKTATEFIGCSRGFSGISNIDKNSLEFSSTQTEQHADNSIVYNLSILFLQKFAFNVKKKISPGFEEREFFSTLNGSNFIKNIKSFYTSKGSDESFRILFGALYGKAVEVIRPRDFLIRPSDAQYKLTKDLAIEVIEGDPYQLLNSTVYQDATDFIEPAQGTIIDITKTLRNNKEYFIISLDYSYNRDVDVSGTTRSEFSIHPKTFSTSSVLEESTYIDVDSTVGFPESGELEIDLADGSSFIINYLSKTLTQFLECSNILSNIPEKTEIKTTDFIYGIGIDDSKILMKVTGVLGNIDYIDETYGYLPSEKIKIATLGEDSKDLKSNNWFFNVPVTYDVEQIEISDISDISYRVKTYDTHTFLIGDTFTLYASDGIVTNGAILFVENKNNVIIRGQGLLNLNLTHKIRKNISKVNIVDEKYLNLNTYSSNVENVYLDYGENLYIASSSLPTYSNYSLEIKDFVLKIPAGNYTGLNQIDFTAPHSLFTGDSVVYRAANAENSIAILGIYYVEKVSDNSIKLARSLDNIEKQLYVTFDGVINSGFESELSPTRFNDVNLNKLEIKPQAELKKLFTPEIALVKEDTLPGTTGILINGVEVSNYKSEDVVFYGGLSKIEISSGGDGYNVLNPPEILVTDSVGYGASLIPAIEGVLERIDIINPGFGYIEQPIISIVGGSGSGAKATTKLTTFTHSVNFNAETLVNLTNDTVEFLEDHKFRPGEEVIYITNQQKNVSGITTESAYYVEVVDRTKVKFHSTLDNAISGINTVNLTGFGVGIHAVVSKKPKNKISQINIIDPGTGYKNKKVKASGINTASNVIIIPNHEYVNGEIIKYYPTNQSISGLSTVVNYYVTVVDNQSIRLSGISTIDRPDSQYIKKEYVELTTIGTGDHYFNYPEIEVKITGAIETPPLPGQDFNAILQPVFSGKIYSVFIEDPGQSYGSQNIINYEKSPTIQLEDGYGAQVTPIIVNGSIVRVVVNATGTQYKQIPELIVGPRNSGAVLTPIISDSKLIEVLIINGGTGFDPTSTTITVVPRGSGAKFVPRIEFRTINIVEKLSLTNNITKDDGYIARNINALQYTHLYSPRYLREITLRQVGNLNVKDLNLSLGREQLSVVHSPLIGWAYDGNPIYGPYGYLNGNSGPVRALKSSYRIKTRDELLLEDRPGLEVYPAGFFVEDYIFIGEGDLDEHNGRYCITPEFPNGIYAYFFTISDVISDSSSPFLNYFAPKFPYIIGPKYNNKRLKELVNFDSLGDKLIRNTTPYNLANSRSSYEYILNPNKIKEESLQIIKTKSSTIDSIDIKNPGNLYKVNDSIILNDGTIAKISTLAGVAISSMHVEYYSINDIEVVPFRDNFIGVCTVPHNINSTERFKFNSKYEIDVPIVVSTYDNILALSSIVQPTAITGIITYFNINGNLNFPVMENDIYTIGNEKIKILTIDKKSSRIKVERNQDGTVGINTYSINTILLENPRKISFDIGISTNYNYKLNKQFYINPAETLGIGTNGNYTLTFPTPGLGKTFLTIPSRTLYLEDHQLVSGDSLFYSPNLGESISVSSDGVASTTFLNNQELYVTKINNDLIGLSTERSGVGTTDNILYFTGIGSGINHSLITNYDNILIGNISKNTVIVSTSATHGLNLDDEIQVEVSSEIQSTYQVFYDEFNRRFCINKRIITNVNVLTNIIYCENHNFKQGEKVIYVTNSPIGGLQNREIYYIIPITKDSFKLARTYYVATQETSKNINLISSGTGYFYSISPTIEIVKNQPIVFDVSDNSLSFEFGGRNYPAFELKLYNNKELTDEYFTYDLVREGIVGIDSTAKYTLSTENIPNKLYYGLKVVNATIAPQIKKDLHLDIGENHLFEMKKVNSKYFGSYNVTPTSPNTFSYIIDEYPEAIEYLYDTSKLSYITSSSNYSGPIGSIKIDNFSTNNRLPEIKNILTENGFGAVLEAKSENIGKIEKVEKLNIGFDYNIDYTIRPKVNLPKIIKLQKLSTIDRIDVVNKGFGYSDSQGFGYNASPDLLLVGEDTKTVYSNVILDYILNENKVIVIQNTTNITDENLKIITINNDNGFGIEQISYDDTRQIMTVRLKTGFNNINEYPFGIGEKVYVENVPILPAEEAKGYNSSNYNYVPFEILETTPRIGGVGATFTYSLNGLIGIGITPGTVDNFYTNGFVVPEKYLPEFNITTRTNDFLIGETVKFSSGAIGEVVGWDSKNNIIKIISNMDVNPNEIIYGEGSKSYSIIVDSYSPTGYIDVDSNTIVRKGWNDSIGVLNDSVQRIHDSDYYQYFSYDLRSEIDYSVWTDVVDSLNHTAGFKKFGNLLVNSTHGNVGIETSQNLGQVEVINDFYNVIDVNCFSDFDLVTENYFDIENNLKSNEIYFKSRRLQNYIESIGNKVIMVDDISDQFRQEIFTDSSVIDSFNKSQIRFKKYILHVVDELNPENTQAVLVNLIHDDSKVSINQYALVESIFEIGYFDSAVVGPDINLIFTPITKEDKIYSVNNFSYNINDAIPTVGFTTIGESVTINSHSTTGIGTTVIVGISTDKRSAKIILLYSDLTNASCYSDEINYIHNGNTIYYNTYGKLNSDTSTGIGTYNIYYQGSNINIELCPEENVEYKVNCLSIEISDSSVIDTGNISVGGNILESTYVGIASTATIAKSLIYSHSNDYTTSLHQINIEDANNNVSFIEYISLLNSLNEEVYYVDFGNLNSNTEIGSFDFQYSDTNRELQIYFTPYQNIDYQIKIFSTLISKSKESETLEL